MSALSEALAFAASDALLLGCAALASLGAIILAAVALTSLNTGRKADAKPYPDWWRGRYHHAPNSDAIEAPFGEPRPVQASQPELAV